MKRCHQGCGEHCRACEAAQRVADTANGHAITEKDLGDMLLMGHVMAMASTLQKRGPISRLHLCAEHARFVTATAEYPPHRAHDQPSHERARDEGASLMHRASCDACDGDGELAVSGDPRFRFSAETRARIAGLYDAAWRTLRNARVYLSDAGTSDRRYRACLAQVAAYRLSVRYQRRPRAGELAWCIACRGTGLAKIECEGCGGEVSAATLNEVALECVDVLVHKDCDTGHAFFEHAEGWR